MMVKQTSPVIAIFKALSLIPVIAVAILFFSTRVNGQSEPSLGPLQSVVAKPSVIKHKTDTVAPLKWVVNFIDGTKEGVSAAVIEEYKGLTEKFYANKSKKPWSDYTNPDVKRMLEIFKQMNKEQQQAQNIVFTKPFKPMGKSVPTPTQFSNLKNPEIYGVWVDGKKVTNSYLDKFSNTDFSSVFISKLYGGAKKNKTYTHQADLMTNAYYKNYFESANADTTPGMAVIRLPKKQ